MRLGPEDDSPNTLRDLARVDLLPQAFGKGTDALDVFLQLKPFASPAEFGVLSDMVQAAWEPDVYGTIDSVTCFTAENPCTRFTVALTRRTSSETVIHSDKSASGSHFDRPLFVYPHSLLAGALSSNDRSQWILDVIDRTTPLRVVGSDADSFLIQQADDSKPSLVYTLMVYTPNKGVGRPVPLQGKRHFLGHGPGETLASRPSGSATFREIHALLKARQSTQGALPAILTPSDRNKPWLFVYSESAFTGDAIFAVITGDLTHTCLRQATASELVKRWQQWNDKHEAPPLGNDYQANASTLQRLLLDQSQSWRREGFQRNPILLLTPQSLAESVCTN
jgi:hypothetical protein